MTYIEFLIEELLSFFKHEEEIYTRILKMSPPGSLSIDRSRKKPRWIHRIPAGKDVHGHNRYHRRTISDDSDLLRQLADKEYARVALNIIDHDLRILSRIPKQLLPYSQEAILTGMHSAYQSLAGSCFRIVRQAQGVFHRQREWAMEPYEQSDYRPEEKIHTTTRGLNVRSRAELLIAEMLYKFDIPFRYEQVIWIGRYKMAPDFTFLDRDGNEFYWEYCGMMSLPEYRDRQIWRRRTYENAGITEWENMIYTYDATDRIDMREIEAIIRTKILPRI
ncbi:MAG: hypothetical protein IJ109_06330 [Firmicutes bacterium]|nr:hypothetical protein [Bacillota bacterium]